MPDKPNNNIKIELDILQNRNMELLKDFSDNFKEQVNNLSKIAEQLASGVGAGGGRAAIAGISSSASTPQKTQEAMAVGRTAGGILLPPGRTYNNLLREQEESVGAGPSVAPSTLREKFRRSFTESPYHEVTGMTDFERAQFSLGMIGQGPVRALQYASFLAGEGAQFSRAPDGSLVAGRPGLGRIAQTTGTLARIGIYGQAAQQGVQMVAGMMPFGTAPSDRMEMLRYGVNVGEYGGGGFLGTGYGSDAWKTGVGARFEAYKRAGWYGGPIGAVKDVLGHIPVVGSAIGGIIGDPNYSSQQAQEAMGITNAYGWKGEQQDRVLDMMEKYTKRYKGVIGQEQIMQIMEPVIRYGTATQGQAEQAINGMAEAARAAHMSLETFSQQVMGAAMQLSEQTGLPIPQALNRLNTWTAITGQAPDAGAAIMTNERNKYLAIGRTGSFYEAKYGEHAGTLGVKMAMELVPKPYNDPRFWKQLYEPGNERQLAGAREQLARLEEAGILPMTVPQWENLMKRGIETGVNPADAMMASDEIDAATQGSQADYGRVSEAVATAGGDQAAFDKALRQGIAGIGKGSTGMTEEIQSLYKKSIDETLSPEEEKKLRDFEKSNGYAGFIQERLGGIIGKDESEDVNMLAKRILGDAWSQAGDAAAQEKNTVTLDIKEPYASMFRQMINGEKNTSKSNSRASYGKPSSGDFRVGGGRGVLKPR